MSVKPIHTLAKWKIKAGGLDTVLSLTRELHTKSIAEPGNLFYTILQDNQDANTLILYEGYKDEAALELHRNSPHYVELVVAKIRPLLDDRSVVLATPLEL